MIELLAELTTQPTSLLGGLNIEQLIIQGGALGLCYMMIRSNGKNQDKMTDILAQKDKQLVESQNRYVALAEGVKDALRENAEATRELRDVLKRNSEAIEKCEKK